jgi:succinyl-CoA synthetase alpha subunit
MLSYGTRVVGGVSPRCAGSLHCGVPVFRSAREAAAAIKIDVSVMFIPPVSALDAALDAIEADIKLLVLLTEHIPTQDMMHIHASAKTHGTRIIGPNTAGLVTPGECFVGIMPAFDPRIFQPGRIGIISRSGSLGTLVALNLVTANLGQSAFIGIGGDPMVGTTILDALKALAADDRTDGIVLSGEIGGNLEEEAACYAGSMHKPVVAFIAGATAPQGRRMGHAGAIIMGNQGTYASKRAALKAAGVSTVNLPSELAPTLIAALTLAER